MSDTTLWKPNNGAILNNKTSVKKKKMSKGLAKVLGGLAGIFLIFGLILFLFIVRPALAMTGNLNALKADKKALNEALLSRDVIMMEKALDKTEKDLQDLKTSKDKNFSWAKNFGLTKDYYTDADRFVNAGVYAIEASREAVKLVLPFADAAGLKVSEADQQPVEETDLADAFATWVAVMPQIADQMDPVLLLLDKAGEELKPINVEKYPESIMGTPVRSNIEAAQKALSSIDQYAPDIKKALTVVPQLLGVGTGEKRYMIIMQNDKELRATGGFWTNYATFRVGNAMIVNHDFSSKDMYSIDLTLDQIDAVYTFPTAPAAYQKYLKVERLYARDTNISPDFPTAIDKFMFFYKLAMPLAPAELKNLDGIIAIDTHVISELLEVTGPVTVNGYTFDKDNVVLELERQASLELREQANRKKVLGDLMQGMLINVFESDRNLWPKLVDKGVDLAMRKHIIAFMFDEEAQKLLEEYNFAGRIIDPVEGDFSYVVSTNLGGDKTNWFVTKDVVHNITKEGNRYVHETKIKYNYVEPNGEFAPFVKRFRDWVRVYAPLNSEIISVTGTEDGTTTDQERNKTYFTGYIELGPGESKEMTFRYYLPENVVKNGIYDLYIQKQPGTVGDIHTVNVNGKTQEVELTKDAKVSQKL